VSCAQCVGIQQEFGDSRARKELRRYRKKGATGTTRMLIDAVIQHGIEGRSFMDVGGGVGIIQHELMGVGAASGVSPDASPAYLAAARTEATSQGYADRMTYLEGDFVELAPDLPEVDIVTLDRVLCCYHDMPTLVDTSASHARGVYGVVLPRDERRLMRFGIAVLNLIQRLRRRPFRVFAHPRVEVERRLGELGFSRVYHGTSFLWRVLVFTRA
jgi:2-polyprenyl-3-methyl-5-hydroxy-6-metoxy-1,4-benzoquinol methylase